RKGTMGRFVCSAVAASANGPPLELLFLLPEAQPQGGGVAGNEERECPSAGVRGIGLTRRGKSNYLPALPPSQDNRRYGSPSRRSPASPGPRGESTFGFLAPGSLFLPPLCLVLPSLFFVHPREPT